ncbi:MAG: hypothetical protein GTO41_11295 [Burkholderiales bacterium]|nr:hypothetical protein [Burkholderiales bacterium]
MQVANSDTVLGNFSNVSVRYFNSEARFTKRDEGYFVALTDGTGKTDEYQVTHTFGVTPLQQYLVDAPGGRKQALQFAWDSRPRDNGGQGWYHLYPGEFVGTDDPLHWTGRYFNWNYMCAECHSTDVQMAYDVDTDTFATTFSEVSVGCEACHGPGSSHVAQAEAEAFDSDWGLAVDLNDRRESAWVMNPETGIAERSRPNSGRQQPEACGRCHARRSVVAADYEYGRPLADTHMIALLDENLYYADGRIQDEVYVYGSFVQSKMYAAGVTCSDCHEPHSATLHAGPNPNDTCATCHLTAKFAVTEHAGPTSRDCVSCHMQATTYMGIDPRRDHGFRLPDTATDPDHYGAIIAAGRKGGANDQLLEGIANAAYPPIARATMLTLLEPMSDPADTSVLKEQLDDPDPLVRIGALRALRYQRPETRIDYGSHLLRDPIRSVRVEAALTYVGFRDLLPLDDTRAFASAADDFREAMTVTVAMPDAALSLAEFERQLGNDDAASRMYEHAVRIGANSAAVQHAYGLHLVRHGDPTRAIDRLREAARLAPDEPHFTYVYGVALNSIGATDEATRVLSAARNTFPGNFDIAWALVTIYRDAGNRMETERLLVELRHQFPGNAQLAALADSLRQ